MAVQAGSGFSSALSTAGYSIGIDCSGLEVSRKSAPHRGHLEVPVHNILCLRASDPFSVLHKNRRLLSDPWADLHEAQHIAGVSAGISSLGKYVWRPHCVGLGDICIH